MEDSDYELISHGEVDRLKREIDRLKANPFVQSSSEEKLYDALTHLNDSVNKLYGLFESINNQLMKEYQTGNSPEEKIDKILDQNKSIAEALVSFGSRIDTLETGHVEKKVHNESHLKPKELTTVNTVVSSPLEHKSSPVQASSNVQSQSPKPLAPQNIQQSTQNQAQYDWGANAPTPMQAPITNNQAYKPVMQNVQQRSQPMQQAPQSPLMAQQARQQEYRQPVAYNSQSSMQREQMQFDQRRMMTSQMSPEQNFTPQVQIPQVPQYQEDYNRNLVNSNGQNSFPPPSGGVGYAIKPAFESSLDVNYPTPDRFHGVNTAPTLDAPIDLLPPEPKKSLFGKLSGMMKGPI